MCRSSGVRGRPAGHLSGVWAEAHRATGTGVERAKHVRVPAVDESRGAAATATATPHVSAALPAVDRVLTEIQSRQPRSGEGMSSCTAQAAQSSSPYQYTKQMDAIFGKSLRNRIFPMHLQENEIGKPGTGDTPPAPCRAGGRTTRPTQGSYPCGNCPDEVDVFVEPGSSPVAASGTSRTRPKDLHMNRGRRGPDGTAVLPR